VRRLHIIGRHNAGKTTLLLRLIPALKSRGLRVGVAKHAPRLDEFENGQRGDTSRFAGAGADFTLLMTERAGALYVSGLEGIDQWEEVLARLFPELDLFLVEGYKSWPGAKIEVWHDDLPEPPLSQSQDPPLLLVSRVPILPGVPTLSPNDVDSISDSIYRWWKS
jgi:molybdopterin-guanine dinucleotide biosynthesis protein MobB